MEKQQQPLYAVMFLNTCGIKCYVAGNIGDAFSEIALDVKENEFVALEVSSFQLDMIDEFQTKNFNVIKYYSRSS